jgi:dienelactone hydrolase
MKMKQHKPSQARRAFTAALLAAAALPLRAQSAAAFRVVDFEWADEVRQRTVPVRLYLPAQASALQPAPLVVFSHGIGGSRAGYSYLGSHWASQGFASLHLQHVGSDRSLWFGNPFALVDRLSQAAKDSEAIARVQDLHFALDRIFESSAAALLDGTRIVAAGHSYGANTTLLAAGARIERQGRVLDFSDRRVQAAIVISAPPFYGEASPRKILSAVTVPSLHITATQDVILIPGYFSGADDRVAVFDATGSVRKTLAVFEGGSHSMFTDRAGTGGTLLNPQVKQATKELSAAFLQSLFGGDGSALREWPSRYAEIVARFVVTGS